MESDFPIRFHKIKRNTFLGRLFAVYASITRNIRPTMRYGNRLDQSVPHAIEDYASPYLPLLSVSPTSYFFPEE